MATNILMPALSPTMTEGTLSRWLKQEGDAVAPGDVLAEIETDKATMEVEAVDEGVLGRILIGAGTGGVAVNTPIAVLIGEGEAVPSGEATATPPPAPASAPAPAPAPASSAPAGKPAPVPTSQNAAATPLTAAAAPDGAKGRVFASPLARRIARDAGIALDAIKGSGPNGRIVRADVDAAIAGRKAAPAAPAQAPAGKSQPKAAAPAEKVTTLPNSGMRRAIARRLSESMTERPHFYVSMDVELDALLELRSKLNKRSPKEGAEGAFKLSVNDMLIKAAALAHRRVPGVAVSYTDDAILHYETIDISIAVSIPDGLITPIVRDADRKSLVAISNEARELVGRARAGKLKPDEFQGGAFSISNLGMFGVREFTAIINPPQAAILALGAGEKRPVVRHDALAIATVMTATLSSDHRAVDGALAARWLAAFKEITQDPLELLL